MPNQIIFVLSDNYLNVVKLHRNILEQKTAPHKAELMILSARQCRALLDDFPDPDAYDSSLFITDDSACLSLLLQAKLYAIALYHEGNRKSNFSGAKYAVEDIFQLEYRSYTEAYRRLAGIPWDILETPRLYVRESTLADIPDFYRIYQNPSVTDYMEPLFENPKEEAAYLQDYISQVYGFYGFGIWTVILKETGEIIGRAGLNIREGYDLAELGFVIDTALQNRGLAFEVCSAILVYAREELALEALQAFVKKDNLASIRLLEKLGFSYSHHVCEKGNDYQLYTISLSSPVL